MTKAEDFELLHLLLVEVVKHLKAIPEMDRSPEEREIAQMLAQAGYDIEY